jgi:DNA polymerase-1
MSVSYTAPIAHLVLIDGHHLMYRAYYAIPRTMRTRAGVQVNTVFGVASMLLLILKTEEPTSLLCCFDEGEETFRHAAYEDYKAGRAETPQDFYDQIPLVFDLLDAFGFKRLSVKTHEADDLIGIYAREAVSHGDKVTIVTGDRDALQLVNDSVRVAIPHKGYQAPDYMTPERVRELYGISPEQIPDYKALVGDASDNLKGVYGIGPKAAQEILKKYPTLEELYAHLDDLKESHRDKLVHDREQAFFCRTMATLANDLAPPISYENLCLHELPAQAAFSFFKDIESSLLQKRFQALLQTEYGRSIFLPVDEETLSVVSPKPKPHSSQLSLL